VGTREKKCAGQEGGDGVIWRGGDDSATRFGGEATTRRGKIARAGRKRGDVHGRVAGAADPQDATQVFPMAFI
jgi:hypothetical protein